MPLEKKSKPPPKETKENLFDASTRNTMESRKDIMVEVVESDEESEVCGDMEIEDDPDIANDEVEELAEEECAISFIVDAFSAARVDRGRPCEGGGVGAPESAEEEGAVEEWAGEHDAQRETNSKHLKSLRGKCHNANNQRERKDMDFPTKKKILEEWDRRGCPHNKDFTLFSQWVMGTFKGIHVDNRKQLEAWRKPLKMWEEAKGVKDSDRMRCKRKDDPNGTTTVLKSLLLEWSPGE